MPDAKRKPEIGVEFQGKDLYTGTLWIVSGK
jgi:hypothetical protein